MWEFFSKLLEIGDKEFQAIQDEDESMRQSARHSVQNGKLENIEITPDALHAYLDNKLGADGRMRDGSYEYLARQLLALGFNDLREVDECVAGFNDDQLSRYAWGSRLGQIERYELLLQAGMGENYKTLHPWRDSDWFVKACERRLEAFKKNGVPIRSYCPASRRSTGQDLLPKADSAGVSSSSVNVESASDSELQKMRELLKLDVHILELSEKAIAALQRANINDLGSLSTKTEAEIKRQIQDKEVFNELRVKLASFGLSFGMTYDKSVWGL